MGRGEEGSELQGPVLSVHNQTISVIYFFVSFSKTFRSREVGVLNAYCTPYSSFLPLSFWFLFYTSWACT